MSDWDDLIREPLGEGIMYPAERLALQDAVRSLLQNSGVATGCRGGVVAPVGSYTYAGSIMADAFKSVSECSPSLVVILSHALSTASEAFLLPESAHFRTPLATVPVATSLRDALLDSGGPFESDELAHLQEYGIELQLPFIQTLYPAAEILPVLTRPESLHQLQAAREVLAPMLREYRDVLFVAGANLCGRTDRRHSRMLSAAVIDVLLALDTAGLNKLMNAHEVLRGLSAVIACLGLAGTHYEADLISRKDSSAHDGDRINAVSYGAITLDIEI